MDANVDAAAAADTGGSTSLPELSYRRAKIEKLVNTEARNANIIFWND